MRILLQILVFVLSVLPFSGQVWGIEISELSVLSVNSAITPATYDYLKQNFKQTPESTLIVLKLNTTRWTCHNNKRHHYTRGTGKQTIRCLDYT